MRWTDALQAMVDKHGLQKFTGNQATVITSANRKVVYRVWAKDPGYEKWIEIARSMQNNPHIVKVYGPVRTIPTKFKGMPKDVQLKFVKLEKLQPMQISRGPWRLAVDAGDVISNWNMSERNENNIDSFIESIAAQADTYNNDGEKIREQAIAQKPFLETMLELSRHGYNDWREENIMLRGSVLVITDPAGQ